MTPATKYEYLRAIYDRYRRAGRPERSRILDEFCAVAGYHRKAALRRLNGPRPDRTPPRRQCRPPHYTAAVIGPLAAIWEASGYLWSRRLHAALPLWLPWARRRFHLRPEVDQALRTISPATIDRHLRARKTRWRRRHYGGTRPGVLLKHLIPIQTEAWHVARPGFLEIDLVSHSGPAAAGDFLHTLDTVDIHTAWIERRAVRGRGEVGVCQAIAEIQAALPFPLRGLDSDNGSEFINYHLKRYCDRQRLQFTRGRPYKKDDNAHIEQKNWTHVRKVFGYERYDSARAQAAMNALYRDELRLFQNGFQPSVRLLRKVRRGARLTRVYDAPRTPLDRVAACPEANPAAVARLRRLVETTDPFELARTIEQKIAHIYTLAARRTPFAHAA